MLNRMLIFVSACILCFSVPLTMKLQPRVIEKTIERNIIVDSSVTGELEQKIMQRFQESLANATEVMTPQMEAYFRQQVDEAWQAKDKELGVWMTQQYEDSLKKEIDKLTPQMKKYYQKAVDASWQKKEREFRSYFNTLRENSARVVEKFIDEQNTQRR